VGAFSHFDSLFPARTIAASKEFNRLRRAPEEPVIRYAFAGEQRTLEQYLDQRPITGFLLAKGDTILIERYQYGRTDAQRFTSFSMAKTIVGLLIGIAIEEGVIKSIDDLAEAYVPGLKGTEYGRTPIRALLQMQSGIVFREDYDDQTSDIYALAHRTLEQETAGSLGVVKQLNRRRAPPGEFFSYSSADTVVLGLALAGRSGVRSRTMPARSSGSRSARKPTHPGSSTLPARRSRMRTSTPCCGTGHDLDSCWRTTVAGPTGPLCRGTGLWPRERVESTLAPRC
jgi:CubicO group peptidase (beta-lactamase class C family)